MTSSSSEPRLIFNRTALYGAGLCRNNVSPEAFQCLEDIANASFEAILAEAAAIAQEREQNKASTKKKKKKASESSSSPSGVTKISIQPGDVSEAIARADKRIGVHPVFLSAPAAAAAADEEEEEGDE